MRRYGCQLRPPIAFTWWPQFASIKEDVLGGIAGVLFGSKEPAEIVAVVDKWFPVIENILPIDGIVSFNRAFVYWATLNVAGYV